MTKRTVG